MRVRLLRTTALVVVGVLGVLTVAFWLVVRLLLGRDLDTVQRQRAEAVSALVIPVKGELTLAETPGDEAIETNFWLYDTSGKLVAAPVGPPTTAAVATAAGPSG